MQYDARIALVEVVVGDATAWPRRLAARGAAHAGTAPSHKPGNIEQAQPVTRRNPGRETGPREGTVPCLVQVDTAAIADVNDQVVRVVKSLRDTGILESG